MEHLAVLVRLAFLDLLSDEVLNILLVDVLQARRVILFVTAQLVLELGFLFLDKLVDDFLLLLLAPPRQVRGTGHDVDVRFWLDIFTVDGLDCLVFFALALGKVH